MTFGPTYNMYTHLGFLEGKKPCVLSQYTPGLHILITDHNHQPVVVIIIIIIITPR